MVAVKSGCPDRDRAGSLRRIGGLHIACWLRWLRRRRAQPLRNKVRPSWNLHRRRWSKPVIAAINGARLGGVAGTGPCVAASVSGGGGQPVGPAGNQRASVTPALGGTQRLPRTVGQLKAMELIPTGDPTSAQEARALGLVSRGHRAAPICRVSGSGMASVHGGGR